MAKTLEVTHDTKSTSTGVSHSLSGSPITLGLEKHSEYQLEQRGKTWR